MGIQRRRWTDDFRENIDLWKENFRGLLTSNEYELVRIGLILFFGVFLILTILNWGFGGADWAGIRTEAHGMLMDILIFGILLTWFERVRSRKDKIKNYHEQLKDFRHWASEEGVLRKVGILQRLNEMEAPLANLKGTYLSGAHFPDANLREADLEMALFKGAFLPNANFEFSDLVGANFEKANLLSANFQSSNLQAAILDEALLLRANLNGSILMQAQLRMAKLSEASLREANLYLADLEGADLRNANLEMADLRGAKMNWADISQANLQGVKNLTCEQIEYAEISKETKLPNYMEKIWNEDAQKYNCKMVKPDEETEG